MIDLQNSSVRTSTCIDGRTGADVEGETHVASRRTASSFSNRVTKWYSIFWWSWANERLPIAIMRVLPTLTANCLVKWGRTLCLDFWHTPRISPFFSFPSSIFLRDSLQKQSTSKLTVMFHTQLYEKLWIKRSMLCYYCNKLALVFGSFHLLCRCKSPRHKSHRLQRATS